MKKGNLNYINFEKVIEEAYLKGFKVGFKLGKQEAQTERNSKKRGLSGPVRILTPEELELERNRQESEFARKLKGHVETGQ